MDSAEFVLHRKKILDVFRSNSITQGIILYEGGKLQYEPFSNSDLEFYQEAFFYWLTGWSEPDASLIIDIATEKSIIFVPDLGDDHLIWTGPITSKESIKSSTGVSVVLSQSVLRNFIDGLLGKNTIEHFNELADLKNNSPIFTVKDQFNELTFNVDRGCLINAAAIARKIKTEKEVQMLKIASEKTAESLVQVMKKVTPGMSELEVSALFKFYGRILSFPVIVGCGNNANFLHRYSVDGVLKSGELLLVDCGVFHSHYAGDITRTFPVSKTFSPTQKTVYQLLLDLQVNLTSLSKPGISFRMLNQNLQNGVVQIMKELKLIPAEFMGNVPSYASLLCPHGLTHNVGVNVHDICSNQVINVPIQAPLTSDLILEPNMVITIEPGLYFNKSCFIQKKESGKYPDFDFDLALSFSDSVGGIRIEDTILITENDPIVLSAKVPKTIKEIEDLLK